MRLDDGSAGDKVLRNMFKNKLIKAETKPKELYQLDGTSTLMKYPPRSVSNRLLALKKEYNIWRTFESLHRFALI